MGASLIRNLLTWCEHLIRRPAGHLSLKRCVHIRLGGDGRGDPKTGCRERLPNLAGEHLSSPADGRVDAWMGGWMDG